MRHDAASIHRLLEGSGLSGLPIDETGLGTVIRVDAARAPELMLVLRDGDGDYRMLVDFLGTDTGELIEITYHLRSFSRDSELYVKADVAYDGELQSVWNAYPSALMPERETAELFGLRLAGHPNPTRLLTTDGVEPLLRKSVPIRTVEEVRAR